jgi:hypothetical protein
LQGLRSGIRSIESGAHRHRHLLRRSLAQPELAMLVLPPCEKLRLARQRDRMPRASGDREDTLGIEHLDVLGREDRLNPIKPTPQLKPKQSGRWCKSQALYLRPVLAIPTFALVVPPPHDDALVGRERERVIAAGSDVDDAGVLEAAHMLWRRILDRDPTGQEPRAELAVPVPAPDEDSALARQRKGVGVPADHLLDGLALERRDHPRHSLVHIVAHAQPPVLPLAPDVDFIRLA